MISGTRSHSGGGSGSSVVTTRGGSSHSGEGGAPIQVCAESAMPAHPLIVKLIC